MTPRLITPSADEWPDRLNELGPEEPPKQLYLEGKGLPDPARAIAVVGTRRPTTTGLEIAAEMSTAFAEAGLVVVSGLALGIDAAAHRAALEAGGHTVAVLGCGIDVLYPQRNVGLHRQIATRGTLVTEYPPGAPPLARHFPSRNRIIVGLVSHVLVVEGGFRSGALITARIALDANRDVFAVPGSPRNAVSVGPNKLIRTDQARLAGTPQDVFDHIAPGAMWKEPYSPGRGPVLDDDERDVLHSLESVAYSVDRIAHALGRPHGEVALALAKLELRGMAQRTRVGLFQITDAGTRASLASA